MRLEQVAQVPVVLPDGRRRVVWAGFRRLFQPEAEPVGRVDGDGQGPLPFGDLTAELLELCRAALDRRVGLAQGGQPGVVGGVELRLRRVFGIRVPTRARWSTWIVMNSRRTAWAELAGGSVVSVPVSALADGGISPASSASRCASSPMNTGIHAATV